MRRTGWLKRFRRSTHVSSGRWGAIGGGAFVIALLAWLVAGDAVRAQGAPLPLTGELAVPETTAGSQDLPEVGMRDAGDYVVVWQSDVAGGGRDIFHRRFAADGSAPFGELVVNQNTAGDQLAPAIEVNGSGDWIVIWASDAAGQAGDD